jgi:hypothetical protein
VHRADKDDAVHGRHGIMNDDSDEGQDEDEDDDEDDDEAQKRNSGLHEITPWSQPRGASGARITFFFISASGARITY